MMSIPNDWHDRLQKSSSLLRSFTAQVNDPRRMRIDGGELVRLEITHLGDPQQLIDDAGEGKLFRIIERSSTTAKVQRVGGGYVQLLVATLQFGAMLRIYRKV